MNSFRGHSPSPLRAGSRLWPLLPVPVHEERPLPGDAVDVRRLVAHLAQVVGADVALSDVVAPEDEDVRLLAFLPLGRGGRGPDAVLGAAAAGAGHQGKQKAR